MNLSKRASLVDYIHELGFTANADKTIAVTLDAFFEGNEDTGSLARHLDPHPGMEALHYYLQRFANENGVEVYVEIYEVDEDDEELWPTSERVYVIGDVERGKLEDLLSSVFASEIEALGEFDINGDTFDHVSALRWD